MQTVTPLESVLKRDRAMVVSGLLLIAALAWGYTVYLARGVGGSDVGTSMAMPNMQSWGAVDWGSMFVMWSVMMVAMMVPTAAPMILLFATVNRKRKERQHPYVPTIVFTLGYVLVWTGFAAVATAGNWVLHTHALLSSMMGESSSNYVGAALLLSAGAFQWTPLKYVCLSRCRSPIGFLMTEWREGTVGALAMGLKHGTFCLACCWILMSLLFVLGVMNLMWIAALAAFVLLEKVVPAGKWVSRASGLLLLVWGFLVLGGVPG